MKFDISMARLNAKMNDEVYMTLDPDMSEVLCAEAAKLGEADNFIKDAGGRVTVKLH